MATQLPPGLGSKKAGLAPSSQPPGLGSSKIEPAPSGQKPNKSSHLHRRQAGNGVSLGVAKSQTSIALNAKSIHLQTHAVQTSGGTVTSIPAIDSHWARPPLDIPVYLPSQGRSVVELTAWHAALPELQAQLLTLLVMPLHIFWSYVLYDAALVPFIDSVLRFAPRCFDLESNAEDLMSDGRGVTAVAESDSGSDSSSQEGVVAATFRVLLRIATPMHSKQELLDADHWRELVYDNWVLDAPKLLDACALYGFGSARACGDLVSRVLSLQPRYAGDMAEAIGAAAEALSQLCGRDPTQPLDNAGRTAEVWALPMQTAADAKETADVLQLADWLLDCAGTLHATLRVCAESLSSSLEALLGPAGLITAIQMAVEVALPTLANAAQAAQMTQAEREAAGATLRAARVHFAHAAHQTLRWCVFFPASGKRGDAAKRAQQVLLAAAKQLADPCRQLKTLKQVYERVGVPWLPAANATGNATTDDTPRGAGVLWQQVLLIDGVQGQLLAVCDGSPHRAELLRILRPAKATPSGAAGDGCSAAEREAVRAVRDVFSDLGTGFILSALRCFGGSPTTVVEALLEDKLPESLRSVPRSLERLPSGEGARMQVPPQPQQQQQPGGPLSFKQKQKLQRMEQQQRGSAKGRMVVEGAAPAASDARARTPFGRLVGDRSDAFHRFAIESAPVGEELYDDELDDSLQLGASALGGGTGEANGDDAANERSANASVTQSATVRSGGGAGGPDLPTTAPEWVRAIGLGQYAEAFRAKGILRLEIAATLTVDDLERMHVMEKHRSKLLSSAARLGERLQKRGKTLPSAAQADTSGYAQVSAIHYDEETGDFWGEEGRPQNQPPVQAQERSTYDHVSIDRRRQLNDRRKARVGNHNRKARAYGRRGPE